MLFISILFFNQATGTKDGCCTGLFPVISTPKSAATVLGIWVFSTVTPSKTSHEAPYANTGTFAEVWSPDVY
jgi:hypothetical protein